MPRVAIIDPYLDSLGGGEKYILSIAAYFLNNNYDVTLLFDKNIDPKAISQRFNLPLNGLKILKVNLNSLNFFKKYLFLRRYDICFTVSDGSIPTPFSSKNYLHFQVPFNKIKPTVFDRLKLLLFDEVIVNSNFTKSIIDKTYKINSKILFPPVSIFKSGKKENSILSIGRFDAILNSKRQDILIEAFKILSKKHKNFRLSLVGGVTREDQRHLNKFKKMAAGLKVDFYPNLPFNSLVKLISTSKIYWHATGFGESLQNPENFEHFGISILEAASAGCVPFVYNGGGPKEFVVDNENGFLFNSTEELAQKTEDFLAVHKQKQDIVSSARQTAQKYSIKNFYINAEKIFN